MRDHEMQNLMNSKKNRGICFSSNYRLPLSDSFIGSAVFATTGAGKTSKITIPNILNLADNECSLIVVDAVDNEEKSIYALTSGYLHEKGFKIKPINIDDPERSFQFNHLSYCENNEHIKEIAHNLASSMAGKDPIWHIKGFELIYLIFSVLARLNDPDYFNQYNAVWLLRNFGAKGEGIEKIIVDTLHPDKLSGSYDLWATFKSLQNAPKETLQGFISTAIASMYLWQEGTDNISRITASDNLELQKLREEKTIVYLRFKKNRLKKYGVFLNLFISTLMRILADSGYKEGMLPVFMLLDEFGNLPAIDNFDGLVSTLRSYKVSINITAQSISQLIETYGRQTATTILNNLNNKLFLGGLDLETCEMVSRMLGYQTIHEVVAERGELLDSKGKQRNIIKGQPLASPEQIRMLPFGHGVGIFGNHMPIYFDNLKGYYEDKTMLKKSSKPPHQINFPKFSEIKRVPIEFIGNQA